MKGLLFRLTLFVVIIVALSCGPEYIGQTPILNISSDSDLRAGPGPDYQRITTVKAGTQVFLLESENDWHKVRLPNGATGWVFKGITRTQSSENIVVLQDARVRRGPGEQYSAFAIVKKGKTLNARGVQGNWFQVDLTDGKTGWISKSDAEKVTHRNLIANQNANILQSPDVNSRILVMVDKGTELVQLRKQGEFYMIRLPGGATGWIKSSYVGQVKERTILVKDKALIRYGPSVEFNIVGAVEKGTRLTQLDKRDSWYQVRTPHGEVGWIYKDFIQISYEYQGSALLAGQPDYVITNTDCNIRQGYGTNWRRIARVKKGTLLIKIGQKDNWLRIRMPNQRIGWIRQDLVNYDVDVLLTLERCNIRLGPSTNYRIKTTVEKGTPLAKISEEAGWSRVYLPDGEIGWIRNDLRADKDVTLFSNRECNVREGPGTNYNRIDRIPNGTPVKEIGRQNNWRQVRLPSDKIGWIREDLLDEAFNQLVTNDYVNIRFGPGTAYRVLTKAEKLTPLTQIGEQGNWFRVKLNSGKIGWIRKDLVSFSYYPSVANTQYQYSSQENNSPRYVGTGTGTGTYSSVPSGVTMTTTSAVNLRMGPSTNDPIITTLTSGTSVNRIDQRGEWYEVITRSGTRGYLHQSGFDIGGSTTQYTLDRVNLRRGPTTNYTVIKTLERGTEVKKIEQRDDWVYVQLNDGTKGWIHKDYVGTQSVPPPVPESNPQMGTLITKDKVNIRKGPGTNYPVVRVVLQNTTLNVIGKHENWFEVKLITGEKGWVSGDYTDKKELKQIIVVRNAEVHQEPDTQSGLLATVETGGIFRPIAREGGWYRIQYRRGDTGWVEGADVRELKYPKVYVNSDNVNIRRTPDENASRIAVVKEGVELNPIDDKGEWLFIELPRGDKGWIKKSLVNRQQLPRIIIVKETRAYEQPSSGSRSIASLYRNDEYTALDKKDNWFKVLLHGAEIGWVYAGYVKEKTKGMLLVKENSHVRMGPGADYQIIGSVRPGEQLKWLDEKSDWCQVQVGEKEIGWIQLDLAKDVTLPPLTATKNSSVYAGPGSNYAVVGTIRDGRKYTPRTKKNGWYQIELSNATEGWVYQDVFRSKKSRVVFTLDTSNIRRGPGLNYEIVHRVEPATDLTIIGSEGDWYYVELQDGIKGYIKKDLVFE